MTEHHTPLVVTEEAERFLIRALERMVERARMRYPHFECRGGQDDIQLALDALWYARSRTQADVTTIADTHS